MSYNSDIPGETVEQLLKKVMSGEVVTENTSSEVTADEKKPVSGEAVANYVADEVEENVAKLNLRCKLVGANDTLVRAKCGYGLPVGAKFRVVLSNPYIKYEDVKWNTDSYDRFAIVSANADESEKTVLVKYGMGTTSALEPYYDIEIPDGHDHIIISMRASAGFEEYFSIIDATAHAEISDVSHEIAQLNLSCGKAVELVYDDSNIYSTRVQLALGVEGTTAIGYNLSTISTVPNNSCKNIIVALPEVDNIAWLEVIGHYNTTSSYGSLLVDENDVVLGVLLNRNHRADVMAVPVPTGAKKLILSVIDNNLPTIICHPYNELEFVANDVAGARISITKDSLISTGFMGEGFRISDSIGTALKDNYGEEWSYNDKSANIYLVPVSGYKTMRCTHFKTFSSYGSAFVDENMTIVGGFYKNYISDAFWTKVVSIPSSAKFLLYFVYDSIEPHIELYNEGLISSFVDNPNICVNGDIIGGEVVKTTASLLLPAISMEQGFHISLNDGFEFKSAHLYYNDTLVCADYQPSPYGGDGSVATPFTYFGNRVFSMNQILPQFKVRLVVIKSDGSDITPTDLVIKEKTSINYQEFPRLAGENIPEGKQAIARKRLNQMLNLVWKAEADILPSNTADYRDTHYKRGRTYISTPYSEASEFSKYLGWCTSFRTFLTACMNKRSVMYTERISRSDKKSAYGIDYNGLSSFYSNPYYGSVCTGLTQYVLNLPNLYISGDYHNGRVPNTTKIVGATSASVQPLDYLWNEGHCSIISDILLDDNGNRKFIVWAEQTFPVAKNTVYTLEEFDKRCAEKSIEVWRYSGWDTVVEPEPTPYIQSGKYEWQTPLAVDEDIHLFCGDYAAFAKGDPIFFNANREKGYTQLEVYADGDEEMAAAKASIDLSVLDNDGLYPDEDWVIVDFTDNLLSPGKYKARLEGEGIVSGVVHFELVEVLLEASYDSGAGSTDISYSCSSNGVPVLLRRERITGMYNAVKIISSSGLSGTVTTNWKDYSDANYIKIYVECEYGMVVKQIKMQDI